MPLRSLLAFVLPLLSAVLAVARWDDPDAGLPVLGTFSVAHLGTAYNTTVVEDSRGRLYAGNDQIFEYDGTKWSAIEAGEATYIDGLMLDETNRIWCGGVNDLGYLDEDATGQRRFHSLRDQLPPEMRSFFVRSVHRHAGKTLYVCIREIFVWDGRQFAVQSMPVSSTLHAFDFEGATYITQKGTGLWRWDGSTDGIGVTPVALAGLEHETVRTAWRAADGHLAFLTGKGILHLKPTGAELVGQETINELNRLITVSALPLSSEMFAVTTQTAGIFIVGADGRLIRHLERRDGLPNLNCMEPGFGRDGRLWLGVFNHVCRIDPRHVQTVFNASNGHGGDATRVVHSSSIGTLSATLEAVRILRPGTTEGARFEPLPKLEGSFTDLAVLADGSTVASGMHRLIRIFPDHHEVAVPASTMFHQIVAVETGRPRLAVGEGDRISLLDLDHADPRIGSIGGFPEAPTRLAFDRRGHLWVSLRRTGVIEVPLQPEHGDGRRHFLPGRDLPEKFHDPAVFVLDGIPFAFSSNAVLELPEDPTRPPRPVMAGLGFLSAERAAVGHGWAVAARTGHEPRLARLSVKPGEGLAIEVTDQVFRNIGIITEISRTEGNILWIGGSEGTVRLDAREVLPETSPRAPLVQAVLWRTGEEEARLPLAAAPSVAFHRAGTIEFQLRDGGDPFAATQLIETRLAGVDREWRLTGKARTIAGLDEGRYTLEARAVGFLGNPGPVVSYTFTILPPWFRTPLAYLGYVLTFAGSVFAAAQWRTRRIRKQNAQLERLVNRRTEELAQAVSARSAFLANMGHEIRNPLNGVVGLVDMLRSRQLATENKALVDRIGTCADQLISVIDDVLEYARIDAGRIALRVRPFTVREPVEAAIDIFHAARPEARIDLHGTPEDLDAHIMGDPDRVRHILVNYLANALKFGGGTPVDVGVRHDGPLLVFSVADRGPGIAAEEQTRLFVRFSRGSLAYQQAIPGTGLGLAACKAYAEAMGGDVSVESELGRGSTFFLRVPFQPATAAARPPAAASPDLLVGRRALVVDDQDFNRFVLCDLLGRMGASAAQASTIDEARDVFRAQPPDIVFVDFDLAGATGADLAEWIRKEAPAGRDVPIVATTAFEVDEVRRRCTEAAMDGFLAKPVTAQRLAEVVARIESVRSGGTPPAAAPAAATTPASFLDILAGGDPVKRVEIERATWREVLIEAMAAHRALRRDDAPLTARHAHRLVSAALMLSQRELVAMAREMNGQAKAGDLAAARLSAERLRQRIRAARRPDRSPAAPPAAQRSP